MSNNEETGPSDQDADEMDYEGEQDYLDFLTAKQGLQVRLDDGTDTDTDTDGVGTDGGDRDRWGRYHRGRYRRRCRYRKEA